VETLFISYPHTASLPHALIQIFHARLLSPTEETHREALNTAEDRQVTGGTIFDCILAHTARGKVDTIWTDNTKHFTSYPFLKTENPLKWDWKETEDQTEQTR